MTAANYNKIPGFYIAHHRWFDSEYGVDNLYKVGHSDDLRRRLIDGAYTTCFSPGFRFVWTFETCTKERAHRLETGVLHCAAARRLIREEPASKSELVRMEFKELAALAQQVAKALGVAGTVRTDPSYSRPKCGRGAAASNNLLVAHELRDLKRLQVGKTATPLAADLFDSTETPMLPSGTGLPETPAQKAAAGGAHKVTDARREGAATDAVDDYEESDADLADLVMIPGRGGDALNLDSYGAAEAPLEDRAYQTAAIAALIQELSVSGRAILQMACRCGKTRVAHGVIQEYVEQPRIKKRTTVLYLVPGLALLRQTAQKLDRYGIDADLLLVGSDTRPLEGLTTLRPQLQGAGTTDPDEVRRICEASEGAPLLVIATYQSSPLLPDIFDLSVFDESHRVCGDARARPFTHILLNHTAGDRLYMSATPRYDAPLSMKDRALFGGVAYAYHMREGIDAGYVNSFGLELVGREKQADLDDKDATSGQIVAALGRLDEATGGVGKLLVFCRSIRHASNLCRDVEAALGASGTACLCAHSRMPRSDIARSLARFCAPGSPAVLFNCHLFQEGIEIPSLNGVFFASPRHSPRDIIQSLCRPLNVLPGKPPSKIFIPVAYDLAADPAAPANLERFASIVPYFDALIAEDPLLYEHLLDPHGTPYSLEWVDSAAGLGGEAPLRYKPDQLLSAARRSVRRGGAGKTERLLRADKIPWEIGFGELRRIVTACGRYPKTTDAWQYSSDAKVNFGQFYRRVRAWYVGWLKGESQPLEPHQINALAALPGWDPYGIEGPYPWRETIKFLEKWLVDHDGIPPMVEINKGGYVGLEATPMERLSGTLTCVNQSDGRDRRTRDGSLRPGSGFTLDAAKQKDLDELCKRWDLRWRKDRRPASGSTFGSLVEDDKGKYIGAKTFIQEAYGLFKEEWQKHRKKSEYIKKWFPGYPITHQRQERTDVWNRRGELIPPRWRSRGQAKKTKTAGCSPAE